MKQTKDPPRPVRDEPRGTSSALMGKRHEYSNQSQRSLGQIARKIGFSSDEISELERLYSRRFKEIKFKT